jgi:hypothetical protein
MSQKGRNFLKFTVGRGLIRDKGVKRGLFPHYNISTPPPIPVAQGSEREGGGEARAPRHPKSKNNIIVPLTFKTGQKNSQEPLMILG